MMMEEKTSKHSDAKGQTEAQAKSGVDAARRIPATSVAVMICILLIAFLCAGVYLVTNMVEAKHAVEPIKGKSNSGFVEYPLPARLPDGVAAEVNGVEIPESQITNFIMTMRNKLGLEDQQAWDEWMIDYGVTTENIRNRVIMYYVNNEIIDQIADEMDIHPTEADYQATRDELFATPESTQNIIDSLAREGRTLDDYEADIVTLTKRRLIGEKYNEGTTESPEFQEAVLEYIKDGHPEYEEAASLDEIDDALVQETFNELKGYSDAQAFSTCVGDFVERSDVLYSKMDPDRPYQSNSDTYFMKQQIKEQVENMLTRNGIDLGEIALFGDGAQDNEAGSES